MVWIYNPLQEERTEREYLQKARDLSEQESRKMVDFLIRYENILEEARQKSKEILDSSPFSRNEFEKLCFTLDRIRRELDDMEKEFPYLLPSHGEIYWPAFRKGCYFFYKPTMMIPSIPSIPLLFFSVEQAKLLPEQIEFLDGKCGK